MENIFVQRFIHRIENKYTKIIQSINNKMDNRDEIIKELMKIYVVHSSNKSKGYGRLLPFYYLINKDFECAWIFFCYLNHDWTNDNDNIIAYMKEELEKGHMLEYKPYYIPQKMYYKYTDSTKKLCSVSPFSLNNKKYNQNGRNKTLKQFSLNSFFVLHLHTGHHLMIPFPPSLRSNLLIKIAFQASFPFLRDCALNIPMTKRARHGPANSSAANPAVNPVKRFVDGGGADSRLMDVGSPGLSSAF